jgi:biotin carboxyl carrier protein
VQAGAAGRVRELRAAPGSAVVPGQLLAVLDPA